jgi:hypothetical protein
MNDQQEQQPYWTQQPDSHFLFYDQQTQSQPRLFSHALSRNIPPPRRQSSIWQWYKSRTKKMKLGISCGTALALLLFFSCIGTSVGFVNLATQATPTPSPIQASITTPIILTHPTPIFTRVPTPTPPLQPIAALTPTPNQSSRTPTPCPGVNCNPWGYNFSPGKMIYTPPATFCSYFSCVHNFANGHGYVVKCKDTMYSKSGGIQGACSSHGGVQRPLYAH